MQRRSRHPGHRGPRAARTPQATPDPRSLSPKQRLRAVVELGIIAAAAGRARMDLDVAAASTARLGALTSGMWRALSRELETAAERLDRLTDERLHDIEQRARDLEVDVDEVLLAGAAAGHLEDHRVTLAGLIEDDDVRRLMAADILFGCDIDETGLLDELAQTLEGAEPSEDGFLPEADDDDDDDDSAESAVRVRLFVWPTPLSTPIISLMPGLADDATGVAVAASGLSLEIEASTEEALATLTGLPPDRLNAALSALAVACWKAHELDELPVDEDDDEDEDELDDVDEDDDDE